MCKNRKATNYEKKKKKKRKKKNKKKKVVSTKTCFFTNLLSLFYIKRPRAKSSFLCKPCLDLHLLYLR